MADSRPAQRVEHRASGVIIPAAVVLIGMAGIARGLATHGIADPFPWVTAVVIGALAAASRRFGLALPGKGYASFLVGAAPAAIVALGWPTGALVVAIGSIAGDVLWRRAPFGSAVSLAGHFATASVLGGLMYSVAGGAHGAAAFTVSNLWPTLLLLIVTTASVNATFYLQTWLAGGIAWVDPLLTARWEAVAMAWSAVMFGAALALLHSEIGIAERVVLWAIWLVFAWMIYWLMRSGVYAETLTVVQRLTRAIGARTEFLHAFDDVKQLTGSLVAWDQMGIASYHPDDHTLEVVADTADDVRAGEPLRIHGLDTEALARDVKRRAFLLESTGSHIVVPLRQGERLVGIWSVRHREAGMYRKGDADLLAQLAPSLGISLALARLIGPLLEASERTIPQVMAITDSTRVLRASADDSAMNARAVAETVRGVATALEHGARQSEVARETAVASVEQGEVLLSAGERMVKDARNIRDATTEAIAQLSSVAEVVTEGTREVANLRTISRAVERFRASITELADQSDLLALNAAIEAGRAGSAARGFSVIATEMRSLAERSMAEAEGVRAVVGSIGATVDRTIELMERTGSRVETVVQSSAALVSDLDEIVRDAEEVARTGEQIGAAAQASARESGAMVDTLSAAQGEAARAAHETDASAAASRLGVETIEQLNAAALELSAVAEQLGAAAAAARSS